MTSRCVRTWQGWLYLAVVQTSSRARSSAGPPVLPSTASSCSTFVLMAVHARRPQGTVIDFDQRTQHRSNAGVASVGPVASSPA